MLSLWFLPPPPFGLVVYIFLVLLSVGNADRQIFEEWISFHLFVVLFSSSLVSLGSGTNDNQSLLFNVFPSSSFFFLCNQQLWSRSVEEMAGILFIGMSSSPKSWVAALFHVPLFHVWYQIHFQIMMGSEKCGCWAPMMKWQSLLSLCMWRWLGSVRLQLHPIFHMLFI